MSDTLQLRLTTLTVAAFMRGYIITMRPYLLFVSGVTGITGMAFGAETGALKLLAIAVSSFFSYGFGQALTDCFQTDTDSISSPYRPLVRGVISRRTVMIVSLAGLAGCVGLLGYLNPLNLALGLLAGAGLATYTWFKRRWWGGPWYNAWIVCVLFTMGALGAGYLPARWSASFGWCAAGTFFAYANFVLAGYFKDIVADAATGYETLPVRYGRKRAAIVSDLLAAGVVLSMAVIATGGITGTAPDPRSLFFFAAAAAMLLTGQRRLHRNDTDALAHRAIGPVLHAYVLFLCGAAVLQQPGWFFPLTGFYAAFCLVLSRRPEPQQI